MKKLSLNKFISMALAVMIILTMTTVISGCSSKASEVKDKSEVSTSSTSASETVKDDENKDEQNSDTSSSQEQEEKSGENKDTQEAKDESQSSNTQSTASSSQKNQSSNTNKNTSSNSSTSTNKNSSTSSKPQNTQSTASQSSSSTHTHKWTNHTAKRWHENIVTVVDQPAQYKEYTLYRMYWYDTNEWEETRDPERFDEWNHDMNGGPLSPNSISMVSKPEDCVLFKGYNDLGQPTYTNDHSIISGLYDTIPEVTHEEDQGWYEEYVDYVWCPECGAKK